jgi:divalent metal cation (Fe/Co/Zn/Cd) transporter
MMATIYKLYWLDPLVAGIIGFSILYIGWEPFVKNLRDLTGRAPQIDLRPRIESLIRDDQTFRALTSFRAHHVGPTIHVSITVKAPGDLSLRDVHEAEETLRTKILDLSDVSRVFIHVEPPSVSSPN